MDAVATAVQRGPGMRIYHDFEYSASYGEVAGEFLDNDSEYQTKVLNVIGTQFRKWANDPNRTMTHVQMLEISEGLNDDGRWFVRLLSDYLPEKKVSE